MKFGSLPSREGFFDLKVFDLAKKKIEIPELQEEQSKYLFFTDGSSDKEYHLHLRREGSLWCVHYANGRRGSVGTSKQLVAPSDFTQAYLEYINKLNSKMKDGYTESESGVRFTNSPLSSRASGHMPQQCMPISLAEAELLASDAEWGAQEKANGERRTLEILSTGEIRGINKRGLYVNIPETWVSEFSQLKLFGDMEIDGEAIGDRFYAFDLLKIDGKSIRSLPFKERYARLLKLDETGMAEAIPSMRVLSVAFSKDEKDELLRNTELAGGEGLVYKKLASPYESGANQDTLKLKFFESATCIVISKNVQRSVSVGLLNASNDLVEICNVTYPEKMDVNPGDLMEVQYLYFNPGGGFEIPTCLGLRNDIERSECRFTQITRLKPGVEMDEDGGPVEIVRIAERC